MQKYSVYDSTRILKMNAHTPDINQVLECPEAFGPKVFTRLHWIAKTLFLDKTTLDCSSKSLNAFKNFISS